MTGSTPRSLFPPDQTTRLWPYLQSIEANPAPLAVDGEPLIHIEDVLCGGDRACWSFCTTTGSPPIPSAWRGAAASLRPCFSSRRPRFVSTQRRPAASANGRRFAAEAGVALLARNSDDAVARRLAATGVIGFHYSTTARTLFTACQRRDQLGGGFRPYAGLGDSMGGTAHALYSCNAAAARCAARGLARAQRSVDSGFRRSAIAGRVARHQGHQCRRRRRNRGYSCAAVPRTGAVARHAAKVATPSGTVARVPLSREPSTGLSCDLICLRLARPAVSPTGRARQMARLHPKFPCLGSWLHPADRRSASARDRRSSGSFRQLGFRARRERRSLLDAQPKTHARCGSRFSTWVRPPTNGLSGSSGIGSRTGCAPRHRRRTSRDCGPT